VVSKTEQTLAERGGVYGDFRLNAEVAQRLKNAVRDTPNWNKMPSYLREGLDLVILKISRMLTGNWAYEDNPHDMVGYAKLMEDRLHDDNVSGKTQTPRMVDLNYLDIQGIFDYLIEAGVGPAAFEDFCKEHRITPPEFAGDTPVAETDWRKREFEEDDGA